MPEMETDSEQVLQGVSDLHYGCHHWISVDIPTNDDEPEKKKVIL